ncbi:MAG TPA: hypothetical protein VFA57_09845 [Pseudolabrys sp.]|jgi:hypothetical protein|nr:hypothetical protein [Pseudolabrys sp.]
MRVLTIGLSAVVCLCVAVGAQGAERRMFIIGADADGYGVDRCLENGAKCGAAIANAYCKSQQYASAASYRKVDRDDITGAIPTGGGCSGTRCNDLVAIICTR